MMWLRRLLCKQFNHVPDKPMVRSVGEVFILEDGRLCLRCGASSTITAPQITFAPGTIWRPQETWGPTATGHDAGGEG